MSYKAIYTYAWDIAEAGVAAAVDEFRTLGSTPSLLPAAIMPANS